MVRAKRAGAPSGRKNQLESSSQEMGGAAAFSSQKAQVPTTQTRKLFDLRKYGVTQGLLQKVTLCPRKATLAYIERLSPVRTGGALAFGSLFHDVLDHCYSLAALQLQPPPKELMVQWSKDALLRLEAQDKQALKEQPSRPEDYLALELNYGLAEIVLQAYFERWWQSDIKYKWLALEKPFEIQHPRHNLALKGKLDGVLEINNRLWLFETKTKARIEDPEIADKLPFETQVQLYLWAVRQLWEDRMPQGVIYNLVRRPQLKQGKTESTEQFLDRVQEDIGFRPDFYFIRLNAVITPEEQLAWEQELEDLLWYTQAWATGAIRYRNSAACTAAGTCEFLRLCSSGESSHLTRRAEVYPELVQLK